MVISSALENDFEATWLSKTNILSLWKWHFWLFWKFLSDEVETVFWEIEAKWSKLFKFKVSHRKHFIKRFWSYLWDQKRLLWAFANGIFHFFWKFLNDEVETVSWKNEKKHSKLIKLRVGHRKHFRKCFWSSLEVKNECPEPLELVFSVFSKLLSDEFKTVFLRKRSKTFKTV